MLINNRKIFLLFIAIFFYNFIYAQDTLFNVSIKNDSAAIKWLSEWPTQDYIKNSRKVSNNFNELFFGKKKLFLNRPVSLVECDSGNFWVLDQGYKLPLEIKNNDAKSPRFIEKKIQEFPSLTGICKFIGNKLLITDSYLNKIYIVDPDKKEIQILNDSLKLNRPTGIAYSVTKKQIYVVETGEHNIVVLDEDGNIIKKLGKRGTEKGEFNYPTHICIDKKGYVYIVDAMNFRIQILNDKNKVISVFGSKGDATGSFACPKGIATDTYGNIYVVDALFNNIQVFNIYGTLLYYFGSAGNNPGQFWLPSGIFINNKNTIFVADSYNHRVQAFELQHKQE